MSGVVGRVVSAVNAYRDPIAIELLVRPGCHLCDDAERHLLRVFGKRSIRVRNILTDRALEDEFVFRIPVARYRDHILAEGLITASEARLARERAIVIRAGKAGD